MNRINLDLKKLLGFKIVANHLCSTKSVKLSSKIGTLKIGSKIGESKGDKSK
jgi:hypothetical protein